MEKFNFEVKKEKSLREKLKDTGLELDDLEMFNDLIDKIKFTKIDIDSKAHSIHVDMIAALLSQQEKGVVFLQNILQAINHNIKDVNELLISSTKDFEAESIDLDIGTNRRVDRIKCVFNNEESYDFTLSADLAAWEDDADSNSHTEKEIFESPLAEDNVVLQKYFGYLERNLSGRKYRVIAKEYLPGKNVNQYLNELDVKSDLSDSFSDVACELAYTTAYLYKRMNGQLLEDLKMENIVYNYENTDSEQMPCRICDHSGYYDSNAELNSVSQIMAQLSAFISNYYLKLNQAAQAEIKVDSDFHIEDILVDYLDSFKSELNDEKLLGLFLEKVKELKEVDVDKRQFAISDDLLDFVSIYLENN